MMKKTLNQCIKISLALVLLFGCRPLAESTSDTKYGFLPDQGTPVLAYFPNGSTIRICGAWQADLRKSIQMWGEAIGKTYNIIEDCDDPDVVGHDYKSDHARKLCATFGTTGVDRTYADLNSTSLGVFQCAKETYAHYNEIILHELGHLFGLCDLYEESISLCDSVNNIDKNSAMYKLGYDRIQPDDINGIRALDQDISKRRRDWTR